eukprot:CAMPEP_0196738624 /NCGR_PEP_ID=MMETSP1091-20130531/15908_1 /TAXON_ID=302021 /ORGANISM="Rhodomonas sp., Strain CCMP768" /LENGTH=190 /DNA_ID=CAMNT_0042082601 /DNA_START=8 /DNA_END=580 /DNA_ORIENTATION=+
MRRVSHSLLACAVFAATLTSTKAFVIANPPLLRGQLQHRGNGLQSGTAVYMQENSRRSALVPPGTKEPKDQRIWLPTALAFLAVAIPTAATATPPEWLEPTRSSLDIGLALLSLLFFLRIPITWYPNMDLNQLPQALIAWPTEPFCKAVRGFLPPLFGVDISPIFMYGILSFIREIFLGQQGVLIMMSSK